MLASLVAAIVRQSTRIAPLVVILALAAGGYAGWFATGHFAMDTNSENLVSPTAPWHLNELRYDAEFPEQDNLILAVIDGASAERADEAAEALTAALKQNPGLFPSVRRPGSGDYFAHDGLLLLPLKDVQATMQQLIRAQPFLGGLAADPSLRGLMSTLGTLLQGVEAGQAKLADLDKPLAAFNATLRDALAGRPAYFGWSALTGPMAPSDLSPTRAFIEIKPTLDFTDLTPGVKATEAIRSAAQALKLGPETGIKLRLTGPVPMSDEEFGSIAENGILIAGIMLGLMVLMLWLALWSGRMIFAVLLTMIVGLAFTASIGLLAFGKFNVISVAFIALFVGLGVDFGIQFCVRYRAERHRVQDLRTALGEAGRGVGPGLTLAALAAAAAFYSFLPTDYAGVKELGLIAGSGMLITYVLSITLLPSLLMLMKPQAERGEVGWKALEPWDDAIARKPRAVLVAALLVGAAGAAAIPYLRFDSNPLDLRSRKSESVSTALDLMRNPQTSPNTVNVLVPSREAANALAGKLSQLKDVSQVLTADTFLPDHQAEKIAAIKDAANILEPTLNPFFAAPAPDDAAVIESLKATAAALRAAAAKAPAQGKAATALADTLETLAKAAPAVRARAADAFIPGLKTLLGQLRAALQPYPVDFAGIPADVKADWISPKGLYRVEAFPAGDGNDNAVQSRFIAAVRKLAPDVTGTPIIIEESGKTIVSAFLKAGLYSFLSITVILLIALRRLGDTLVALAPLVLAGVMTLASCVLLDIPLNFANIIALPLLFGVGVAFDIYFVMAWRQGQRQLLRSPLTRAVVMSAATTATAFGTLSISSHPGTASMGIILMLSLAWILVTMLVVLPALLAWLLPHEGASGPVSAV